MIAGTGGGTRLSARERLLAAADELFYEYGINTVGIDRVIERAGVAKASLYDCFGSKEELIRQYLEARGVARQARINERLSKYNTPVAKILSIFDLLAEVASQPGYRGCAFIRAAADPNGSEKVKSACQGPRSFIAGKFTELAREAGADNPELLAKRLVLLYDGAATSAYMGQTREAALEARAMAAEMLSSIPPKTKRRSGRG
jgi:AcrR family transcriptional regulator